MSLGGADDVLFRAPPEPDDDWRYPAFAGDFYREPDTVTRGVTLGADVAGTLGLGKGFEEDFYREPGDVCRGVTLSSGDALDPMGLHGFPPKDHGFYPGGLIESGFPGLEKPFLERGEVLSGYSGQLAGTIAERFQEGDMPPNAPADPLFKLEATSLYVASPPEKAFEIGNCVLDFLDQGVVSALQKMRRKKFAMKADVFVRSMMFTMKIKVYSQAPGKFAIEFQRRAGDVVSFNGTFRQASEYLAGRLQIEAGAPEAAVAPASFQPLPLPADHTGAAMDEADLSPLLDMASEAPRSQAEAAGSLCQMAEEGEPILCSARVFQCLSQLLLANTADVAYPTARLLRLLAQRGEAAPLFAAHRLLQQMLGKVLAPQVNVEVRRQFAQALQAATQKQTKATLADTDAAELLRTLSGCSMAGIPEDVIQCLKAAELELKHEFAVSRWP